MNRIKIVTIALLSLIALAACDRMKIGYLQTENAVYEPDSVNAYRELAPGDTHLTENAPWTSNSIQGVAGTAPVNYEIYDVTASNGGDAEAFKQIIKSGDARIQGSMLQLFQNGVKQIPNGTYTISLRVYNEDHSAILTNIFRFIVADKEEFYE